MVREKRNSLLKLRVKELDMVTHKIEAHKITKPIQLMVVWFVALLLIDTAFLTAAAKINSPTWLAPTIVISAIVFVPLFLIGVFLCRLFSEKSSKMIRFIQIG